MKKIMATAAAALLAGGVATATAGTASAAPCTTNGVVLQSVGLYAHSERVATVRIHWSETCGTNWATASFPSGSKGTLTLWTGSNGSSPQSISTAWTSAYTSPIYARNTVAWAGLNLTLSNGERASAVTDKF
ncbi:hypothetical protein RKE38_09050 [Phycicoccus sp. M110.8]|uniref:hypothetical protein n=1 Tax=Phycicoccus sp. M110.8 TaxID=3075433 RepID=UPI0028FD49E4|nr:hypothetical protein [Phycicoccus sp. M110.8]MDU0313834.1 hypothetical protein [Phycicoccus sp. M110.8]